MMTMYGSLRLLPAALGAPGLRGGSEVWGARLVSGEDCLLRLLPTFSGFQKCPQVASMWLCRLRSAWL
jgi:hypothetical protein